MDLSRNTQERLVAVVCGSCSEMRACSDVPSFCGCRAVFDRGAPYAEIVVALVIDNAGVGARKRVVFHGRWEREDRDALVAEAEAVGWKCEEASQ